MKKEKKFEKLKSPKGFVLMGTDNNGYRHRYSVKKNEQFKNMFIKFMGGLGFDEERIGNAFYSNDMEDEGVILKISDFKDVYKNYKNKKYDVDVFYGSKKIILIIRCKVRKPMVDNLMYNSKWKKFPKIIIKREKKKRTFLIKNKK